MRRWRSRRPGRRPRGRAERDDGRPGRGCVRPLDGGRVHRHDRVLAYAAKYALGFYGPFREAVESSLVGDRATYQQDPANAVEALREIQLDLDEGADIVMVKPALPTSDVVAAAAEIATVPVAAYQISGEYSMIEAAGRAGLDRPAPLAPSRR
jgi:porphobilinogen synthase